MQPTSPPCPRPGAEPVPGYRLLEPLGRGGFGEVWKCEAPGGLLKAVKFVGSRASVEQPDEGLTDGASAARQEREALERVKSLRHPFILSLERVEEVAGALLVVMELADRSLHGLYQEYRASGLPGVPREELLGYLLEAAEALDWMNFEHGLQHLDVKPHNLFVISGHVKVADFGLVHRVGAGPGHDGNEQEPYLARHGGVTPLYSAPELLRGTLSRHSDQYSLAVLYQQMLTGALPFFHDNAYDLMMQHLSGEPDLRALPVPDRPVVARALAKIPEQRFGSCLEFVQGLLGQAGGGTSLRRSGAWRRVVRGTQEPAAKPHAPPAISPSSALPPGNLEKTHVQPSAPVAAGAHETIVVPPAALAPTPAPRLELPEGLALAAPTAVSLVGFRFTGCLHQTPLGDIWQAEDNHGRRRRALCLLPFIRYDTRLIAHLKALHDPALPASEVHWSPAERLVVLTDWYEGTLRDRFEQQRGRGQPGIARQELLPLLRSAARALDSLYARYGLLHLGLHPRNLLIDGAELRVADFGLVPLVWLPTGQPASTVNGKYAAPELFERRPSRSADQYSLALIYAEMATGVHPRPHRPGSGLHRRPDPAAAGRAGRGNQPSGVVRAVKIDLDLLPAPERQVVARALANDPQRRFESCVAFVEALEAAVAEVAPAAATPYHELPPVIPFASLLGEPPAGDIVLPSVCQLVRALRLGPQVPTVEERKVHGPQNARYFVQPDGSWEYRCPLQLFPGAMPLKVAGFCEHWNGRVVSQVGDSYRLQLEVPVPRGFWERFKQPRQVEVDIQVEPLGGAPTRLTEAKVRARYLTRDRDQAERILAAIAPQLFDSLRLYLQASPEQRSMERWAFTDPVRVYPVLPELELGATLDGVCQNISQGGIRFRVSERPASDYLYLHLHASPAAQGHALLARVARLQETSEGIEVGCTFGPAEGGSAE